MEQLIVPNFVYEKAGWCLSFVRRSYGLPARYPTAYAAWIDTKHKHYDRDFPKDISLPVWFEWYGDLGDGNGRQRYDHVAIYHTDGRVYSSPLTGYGRAWFESVDDLIRSFGNGMKYLGWSEDISGVRVIKKEEQQVITNLCVDMAFRMRLGRTCDPKQREDLKRDFETLEDLDAWIKKLPEFKDKVKRAKQGKERWRDYLGSEYRVGLVDTPADFELVTDKLYRRK